MQLLSRGAESRLYLIDRFGLKAVLKERLRKRYMHEELDRELRRSRTISEARTMHRLKQYGIRVPFVYDVDPENYRIVMEYIEGKKISEVYDEAIRERLGEYVGLMHAHDEIHGDLNVSNVIVDDEGPCIIDFGLSFKSSRIEDKADDLHTLRRSMLRMRDYERFRNAFLKGYRRAFEKADKVIEREKEIRLRGRYRERGSVRGEL